MIITYSRQNPIDMNSTVWSFDSSLNKFYNWKNQPIQGIVQIPNKAVKIQFRITDEFGNDDMTAQMKIYNAVTGDEISGVSYIVTVPTSLTGVMYEATIDLSLITVNVKINAELTIYDPNTDDTEIYRSSCYKVVSKDDDKLIRIEFGNTIDDRPINGILFDEDATFDWYLYADKYDTEIQIVDDQQENDFKGNSVLVDKTHSEMDIFEIIDMPKKVFMGLIAVSENDVIYFNGRRANFTMEKVTESRIGVFEICFMNAFMRVTYSDDDGLLNIRNNPPASLMLIDSENYLNIDSENKLKNR